MEATVDYAALSASERRFLPPAVAVSTIAFALAPPGHAEPRGDELGLWLPLVRRTRAPFLDRWALPGGATQWDETLSDTARRTLTDAVGGAPGYLEQLYSFGSVERSADAQRLVTIAYWALYNGPALAQAERHAAGRNVASPSTAQRSAQENRARRWDDPEPLESESPGQRDTAPEPAIDTLQLSSLPDEAASNVAWFSTNRLPQLAFDHAEIVAHALERLRSKTEYAQVAHRFLGESFTLAQLRRVHEAVQGRTVDPANFRRQALAQGTLEETGGVESGTRHRPAKLYRFAGGPPGSP
ncbi:NUDIX hydrolase [Leucobacter sp. HY1910]